MNRTTHIIAAIGILLAFAVPALAITGTVNRIIIQAATDEELDETVLEPGLLVYRVDDPKDVRIGDGMTAGGISLWNYLALTNPPSPYDRDLDMAGHAIELNSHYRIVAEGGYLSIYHIGTNPVFRLVGSESAGTLGILESVTVGTNIVITVQHVEGDAPPVLEGATDIGDPVWTPVEYDLDRLSSVTITLTFPQPETGVFTYYRVSTSVSEPMANFLVPLLVDGDPVLTAETDPAWTAASGSVVYATTPGYTAAVEQAASAYGWGDHAEAGYLTEEADAAALSAVAAVSGRVDTVEGWGDHAVAGYLTSESDPLYSAWVTNGPGATNAILADGTLVSIDGWGSGTGTGATQLIANIQGQAARTSTYDAGTATLTLTDLPAPEGGGGGTASVGVEGDVLTYSFATNIALLASTNLWPQRILEITNDFTLQVPTMADTNAAGIIWLTVPSISTHTATIPTSSPAIHGYVPALSTNAESELLFRWSPRATGWRVRRLR